MFSENIINLTCCIIIKMPAFRVDKFSAGRTKCRSPMLKRTRWNSLALFLIVNLQGVLKPFLGLDLIDPRSSLAILSQSSGLCYACENVIFLGLSQCHNNTCSNPKLSIPASSTTSEPTLDWSTESTSPAIQRLMKVAKAW